MKLLKITGTTAALLVAAMMPAYGQKEEKEQPRAQQREQQPRVQQQGHAQQPQSHVQQAAPEQQRSEPSPVRNSEPATRPATQQQAHTVQQQSAPARASQIQAPQVQRSAVQARSWQQDRGWAKQGGGWQAHSSFQQGRDRNWAADHRTWAQRGGYGGSYIPQAAYGIYFGSAHSFHIGVMPVMYMGYPRFAYGGYSFMLLDPWPGSWQEDWYASDDVYIDYSDGYYLHNRRYPGVQLAITIAM